ncbi:MAG: DUF4870 domain-containing protein [Haloarculaceae archaeon]
MAHETVADPGRAAASETSTGLDENLAGALSYLFGFLTGIAFLLLEPDNAYVRYHAAQSIAVFGLAFVASVVLSVVGSVLSAILLTGGRAGFAVFGLLSLLLTLVWLAFALVTFAAWLYLMVKAYQGETPRIPVAAGIADRLV